MSCECVVILVVVVYDLLACLLVVLVKLLLAVLQNNIEGLVSPHFSLSLHVQQKYKCIHLKW